MTPRQPIGGRRDTKVRNIHPKLCKKRSNVGSHRSRGRHHHARLASRAHANISTTTLRVMRRLGGWGGLRAHPPLPIECGIQVLKDVKSILWQAHFLMGDTGRYPPGQRPGHRQDTNKDTSVDTGAMAGAPAKTPPGQKPGHKQGHDARARTPPGLKPVSRRAGTMMDCAATHARMPPRQIRGPGEEDTRPA